MIYPILKMQENRVRRPYIGGGEIEKIHGRALKDSNYPEEWLCSVVEANNREMSLKEKEGVSKVTIFGQEYYLDEILMSNPEYYLGKTQFKAIGCQTGVLVKFLDSAMRLAVQAHPDKKYAAKKLNSMWGKSEAYYILSVRDGIEPHIYLGFKETTEAEQWQQIIETQDIEKMLSSLNKIRVNRGEIWYIPAGMVHAIGEGVMMIEIMEPSDWVIRCEFERIPQHRIPFEARFMGKTLDEVMEVFDLRGYSIEEIRKKACLHGSIIEKNEKYELKRCISEVFTNCFEMSILEVFEEAKLKRKNKPAIIVGIEGGGEIRNNEYTEKIVMGDSIFLAAYAQEIVIRRTEKSNFRLCIVEPKTYDTV